MECVPQEPVVVVPVIASSPPPSAALSRMPAGGPGPAQPAQVCKAQAVWLGDDDGEGAPAGGVSAHVAVARAQGEAAAWCAGPRYIVHNAGHRCRCKASRCLKLYCACFAVGRLCSADWCLCTACCNDGLSAVCVKQSALAPARRALFCTRACKRA